MEFINKNTSMAKKILIVDNVHDSLITRLNSMGFSCYINKDLSAEDFILIKEKYIGLILRNRFAVDRQLIDSQPNLKFILRIGSGVEHIDDDYCQSRRIALLSTPEGNAPAVAEHCLALLFTALRHVSVANNEVKSGIWNRHKNKGNEIKSLTIGIIGYGHTGQAFAKLLHHFGAKILVYDKLKKGFNHPYINEVDEKQIFLESDVISLHINYTTDNHYFINKERLQQCQRSPIFINSSRGLSVNSSALLEALLNGSISYACLDVIEFENVNLQIPPIERWDNTLKMLSKMNNVILTPHIAGQTFESALRHVEVACQKVKALNL